MPPKPDVRRLLKKQQTERNKTNKITHPFAKYDETSRLICIVCNSPVKNEAVWQAHLGSIAHRDNIQKLRTLKQQQQQQQQQNLKRRAPSPPQDTNKRIRTQDTQDIELDEQVQDSSEDEEMDLPNDFFDNEDQEIEEVPEEETGVIPTGFFDDPEEEARIQGNLAPEEQAQADLERDLEMFNEAMIDVTKEAKQDQDQDDETFWLERHDDISREQEMFDKRVENLKLMRQSGQVIKQDQQEDDNDDEIRLGLKSSVRLLLKSKPVKHVESVFDDDESDSEEEDWRAQQL